MERYLTLKDGTRMPRLGLGTWKMGDSKALHDQELESLKAGLDSGITLIDTAELYGYGNSERLVGQAIKGRDRHGLFLVDKVIPTNAGKDHFWQSLERSLSLLDTSYLDLYLLHWIGPVPLAETVSLMEKAKAKGLIKNWGVSNFDTPDMGRLWQVKDGDRCAVNQCLYHLGSRGVEYSLLPWQEKHHVAFMAYCPLAIGGSLREGLMSDPVVKQVAGKYGLTPAQLLLAFVLRNPDVIAIPKSSNPKHTLENAKAFAIDIAPSDWTRIDREFPAPSSKEPLDMQ